MQPSSDAPRLVRRHAQLGLAAVALAVAFAAAGGGAGGGGVPASVDAASLTVNLDQWASLDRTWQNGNLNGNNSRYPEGGIVPFRLAIEGLSPGAHSIRINYDFTAGGHKAYDFLAAWNGWRAPNMCGGGGSVSSLCPSLPPASTRAFPADPFVANGLSVNAAEVYSGVPRRLTIWGGTITSIAGPVHAGSVNGNSTGDFLVRFTSTGSAVLLAWGGHLAQSAFWDTAAGGARDGSGEVSGAPWHMRTLQLDGSGNRNQDRSIQPSAIVGELPPFALAPTPTPTVRPAAPPPATPAPTPRNPAPGPGTTAGPVAPAGPSVSITPPPTSAAAEPPGAGGGAPAALLLIVGTLAAAALLATRSRRRA